MQYWPFIQPIFIAIFLGLLIWQGIIIFALRQAVKSSEIEVPLIGLINILGNIALIILGMAFSLFVKL